jgi:hypothetical protein
MFDKIERDFLISVLRNFLMTDSYINPDMSVIDQIELTKSIINKLSKSIAVYTILCASEQYDKESDFTGFSARILGIFLDPKEAFTIKAAYEELHKKDVVVVEPMVLDKSYVSA